MKNLIKFVGLALPVTALGLVSCGKSSNVGFDKAIEYCSNNYDVHAFDDVKGHYKVSIDNLGVYLDNTIYDDLGSSQEANVNVGIKDFTFETDNLPAVSINSTLLNRLNILYTQFTAIALQSITNIGLDFNYYINNGCLSIEVGTIATEGLLDVIKAGFVALNIYGNLPSAPTRIQRLASFGLGVAPKSTGDGNLKFTIGTDNEGFLNKVSFVLEATNLDLWMSTGMYSTESVVPFYSIHSTGSVNIGFSVAVTF